VTACGGADSGPPASDIVSVIPWRGNERFEYVLKDDRGREVARSVLSVEPDGATTRLGQLATTATNRDDSTVVVDSRTLKPASSQRTIVTPADTDEIEVTYTEAGAIIKHGDRQSGLSVPEHAYDNDTSLHLWRTLAFAPGYEASYVTIITNRRSRQTVHLEVIGLESVRVPAGEFRAWRLEIKGSNADQVAWYADTPARPLVKYDNDRGTIYELLTAPLTFSTLRVAPTMVYAGSCPRR
jgi:hypothetical protein